MSMTATAVLPGIVGGRRWLNWMRSSPEPPPMIQAARRQADRNTGGRQPKEGVRVEAMPATFGRSQPGGFLRLSLVRVSR